MTPGMRKNPVRVLVVDDSALMRKLTPQMLAGDESIEVVGTAMDGSFCLKKIEEFTFVVVPNPVLNIPLTILAGGDANGVSNHTRIVAVHQAFIAIQRVAKDPYDSTIL